MIFEDIEKMVCRLQKLVNAMIAGNAIVKFTTDTTVGKANSYIMDTAAANAADLTLPDPTLTANKGRSLNIANYSGAAQNLLSHNGTSLTIKTSTGAAVATYGTASAAAAATANSKLVFESDGTYWVLMQS